MSAGRYDGTSWRLFNKNNTTGIQSRFVYAVAVDKDGGVWFATEKGVSAMLPAQKE